ncbi:MAG: ferric reductase-like transmembrane domain-containing protein [archaeon]|nr:ferric reductase-like transmembrane domain-containing protein [archaeon]
MAKLFEGARKNWKKVLAFIVFSIIFWFIQFWYQLNIVGAESPQHAMIRSLAFSGATFIAIALLSSSVFKFFPKTAKYVDYRRDFGVMGFVFGMLHYLGVVSVLFEGNPMNVFAFAFSEPIDPFLKPIIFALLAYPIFFLMFLTSTDWAVEKLGKKWKALHRLVYFAFMFLVFHFLLINPPAIMNLAGYLLMAISFLALAGELYWFIQTILKKRASTLGIAIGILIIFLYLAIGYFAWIMPKVAAG